jgi:hypothetical protein
VTEAELAGELAAIPAMAWPELRQRWSAVTGRPVPRVKHALLRMALAWELQARIYGGLSRRSEQCLVRMNASSASTRSGRSLKLVREWHGVLHTVTVDHAGVVHWDGQQWRSLSEVARMITGTRWSGPAFFGLKQKPQIQTGEAA